MKLGRTVIAGLVAAVVLCAGWGRIGSADAEDRGADLIAQGNAALKAKEYHTAAACFDEAFAASQDLHGALYLSGRAYEKADDDRAALVAYRAFIREFERRAQSGKPPAAQCSAHRKAVSRVKSLGRTTLELDAIREKHVAKLVAFADAHAKSAPDVAARALDRARDLAVDDPELKAKTLTVRSRVDVPEDRVASPCEEEVRVWTDLIEEKTFGVNQGWSYADGRLTIDFRGGGIALARGKELQSGRRYVYEIEARLLKRYSEHSVVGLHFGRVGNCAYVFLFGPKSVQLNWLRDMKPTGVAGEARSFADPQEWHRLTLKVDGSKVEAYVDGEFFASPEPSKLRSGLAGNYGLLFTDSIVEIRQFRMGELR